MSSSYSGYIGVFDSGVGGISVLKECTALLPEEDFLFFGDSANTPYGEKPVEVVRELSMKGMEDMINTGIKALVIACNTATSIAGNEIREKHPELPIIGIEPAVKPASEAESGSRILVMATQNTLRLEKFRLLMEKCGKENTIYPLPCIGLAERVEQGDLDGEDLLDLLDRLLSPYRGKIDSVVLGCTHYPFVRRQIRQVLGEDLPFYDGGAGTARELRRRLTVSGLLKESSEPGKVVFTSSHETPEQLQLYEWLYQQDIHG